MNSNKKRPIDLRKEYLDSIGWEIHSELFYLNYYKIFFDRNFLDLLKKIRQFKENPFHCWVVKPNGTRSLDDFKIELLRDLHNYLMSSFFLRDKTIGLRNHLNGEYGDIISESEYLSKLIEFKVDEYSDYLKDLRNEFTHRKEHEGISKLSFNIEMVKKQADILIEEKKLAEIIIEYKKSIDQFYKWFFKKIQTIFSEEIEKTNELIRKFNEGFGKNK